MKRFQLLAALAISLLSVRAATAQLTVAPAVGYNISWQGSSTTPGASGPYDTNATPLVGDGSVFGPTPDLGLSSLGVTAFASSDFTNGMTYPQHQISHLNDGVYGNSNSWIAGGDASPGAGLDIASRQGLGTVSLTAFAFSRNEGSTQYNDRAQNTSYTVQYTDVKSSTSILAGMQTGNNFPNPPDSHAGTPLAVTGNASTGWVTAGTITYGNTTSGSFSPWLFNQYSITDSLGQPLLGVTGFRLVGLNANDTNIDELQVFGQATPEPSTFVLAGLGVLGLLVACRHRKQLCGNLNQSALVKTACCFLVVSLLIGSVGHAALIASYNPDWSSLGPITTMADQTGNGNTLSGLVTISNANTAVFNGHHYGDFVSPASSGLGTVGALFTGGQDRTVAAVYNLASTAGAGSTFIAQIAGEIPGGAGGTNFGIEARANNVTGSPYLINFGPDVSSGNFPVVNQLTFAVATYASGSETLYWAFGTNGAVSSATAATTLNTTSFPFSVGNGNDTCCGTGGSQIGQVLVFNNSFNLAAATAEIQSLQALYAQQAPEPSTMVLAAIALVGLFVARRRSAK